MDVIDRDAIERKLSRILGRDLRYELDRLMKLIGDPPNLANVPGEYWQGGWKEIAKHVEPVLVEVFLAQAEQLMIELSLGVNWDLVNTTASRWARQNTEDVLKELFDKRYEHLNESIPRFYEDGWTLGDLRNDLEHWYSPVRAEMIAITETTRAAVEGERAIVEQIYRDSGIRMIPIWITQNDELVCSTCGPRHEKEITDGIYPPMHPRCRCDVRYVMPEVES